MSQNDFTKFFDVASFNGLTLYMKTFMESQRRNFQAFAEAQQRALEGFQAVTKRQGEIISQMVEDNSAGAREIIGAGSPQQQVAKQADLMKEVYEKSVSNMVEIGDMLSKSNWQASDIITTRVTASLTEIKSALEKDDKAATKKAA